MTNQIVKALEHGAQKMGKTIGEDAGKAVKEFYQDTGKRLKKVAENHVENDAKHASEMEKILKGGGKEDLPHAPGAVGSRGRNGSGEEPSLGGTSRGGQSSEGNGRCTTGGDPVDVVSGQMIMSATDLELPGLLPLILRRAYASGYSAGRHFGPGWSATLDQRVQIDTQGIHYAGDDGQILHYPRPTAPDRPVLPEYGAQWPLTWDDDTGSIRIEDPQAGWTRHFDAPSGGAPTRPLTALTDRNGNRITYTYDEDGLPTLVEHSGGYRVAIDSIHTGAGPRIEALRLLDGTNTGLGTTVITYRYDALGRLTDIVNSSGLPLVYAHDTDDRITSWTDRNGHWYEYEYGPDGRVIRGVGSDGALEASFDYDLNERSTEVTDSLGHTTRFYYDRYQHISMMVDPLGHTVRADHDRYGRLLAHTDALGHTTRYSYDARGDLIRIDRPDGTSTSAEYNPLRLPVEIVTADGQVWRQAYDQAGNRIRLTDPTGAVTEFGYDERGCVNQLTDPLGNATQLRCNPAGLLIEVTDPLGRTTHLAYDPFGHPIAVTSPDGRTTRSIWTPEGQPVSRITPDGAQERWTYDAEGNTLTHTDQLGGVTRMEYTHFDLLVCRTEPDGARCTFAYDTELRLTRVTDAQGLTWSYTYDSLGQISSETDFNGRHQGYTHDAVGHLTARTNALGQTISHAYDSMGRLTGKSADGQTTTFGYDRAGRLLTAISPSCSLVREYDGPGTTLTETVNGRTLTVSHDLLGRRAHRRTPSGAETSWSYDHAGNLSALVASGHTISFEHDELGRETARHLAPGLILNSTWDELDRLVAQSLGRGAAPSPLQHRAYTYRADGKLIGVTDQHVGPQRFDLDRVGRVTAVRATDWTETYVYDAAGRLADAQWPSQSSEALGTRAYSGTLVRAAGRTRYEYDAQGRVTSRRVITLSGRTTTWAYVWDAEDRLTHVTTPNGTRWEYRYDPLGRRISKQRMADDTAAVVEWTDFTWDGPALAEQTAHGPQLPGPYTLTWDHQGLQPVAQTERISASEMPQDEVDRRFFAIITDPVGAPTHLIAPDGSTAWQARATLWGTTARQAVTSTSTPLRYPGQYYDPESRLHYNFHRYYDPDTGRYLTSDPLGLDPAPDAYAYVDNPLAEIDPLGLAKKCANVIIERYGNEDEAKASQAANGLVLKPAPHDRQPKWIAKNGVVNSSTLGQGKNYTHKMEFTCKPEVLDWLKQYEIKPTNEPNRYAVPADKVDEFNEHVISTKTIQIRRKR
ncbi:DUF6531 domain-containing protein [Streptomyces sp. NBC_01537]|uniref:DUF6531 domain-containing protein n=1 Tax=Streptomyces sp. NBC_01537 TaxID=2903896 RepID=UPI00386F3A09